MSNNEKWDAFVQFSKLVEATSWHFHAQSRREITSERTLSDMFVSIARENGYDELAVIAAKKNIMDVIGDVSSGIADYHLYQTHKNITRTSGEQSVDTGNYDPEYFRNGELRRVLEYRRKIYNIDHLNGLENVVFASYCLGKMIENISSFSSTIDKTLRLGHHGLTDNNGFKAIGDARSCADKLFQLVPPMIERF